MSEGQTFQHFEEATDSPLDNLEPKPAQNQTTPDPPLEHDATVDAGNLDKIRDLLFGNQLRDHEQQFARLEERLVDQCRSLRADISQRLDTLETYIQTEVKSLNEKLTNSETSHNLALQRLTEEHQQITQSLEQKIGQLDDGVRQKYEEILAVLDREVQALHTINKTDRSQLAALFGELSTQLSADQ